MTSRSFSAICVRMWSDAFSTQVYPRPPPTRSSTTMSKTRDDQFTYVTSPDGTVYGIRYIPHKFLKIKRCGDPERDPNGAVVRDGHGDIKRKQGSGRQVVIYDVSGYWQTSFLDAITTWNVGTSEERAIIAAGKK